MDKILIEYVCPSLELLEDNFNCDMLDNNNDNDNDEQEAF